MLSPAIGPAVTLTFDLSQPKSNWVIESNQCICRHKILEKKQVINKKLNKWEQPVQTGVLAGHRGRETALT